MVHKKKAKKYYSSVTFWGWDDKKQEYGNQNAMSPAFKTEMKAKAWANKKINDLEADGFDDVKLEEIIEER